MHTQKRSIGPLGENLAFLIGMPRSGTTLLSALLNAHSDILVPPEPWVMLAIEQLGTVPQNHLASADFIQKAYDEFSKDLDIVAAQRAMALSLYEQKLEKSKAKLLIDKTPRYYHILDFLEQIFPSSRFICLRRSPFAAIVSHRTTWNISLKDLSNIAIPTSFIVDFYKGYARIESFMNSNKQKIINLTYEDLVTNPDKEMSKIFTSLLPDNILPDKLAELDTTAFEGNHFGDPKIGLKKKIDPNNASHWREEIRPEEAQAVIDLVGPEIINKLGYQDDLKFCLSLDGVFINEKRAQNIKQIMEKKIQDRLSKEDFDNIILKLDGYKNYFQKFSLFGNFLLYSRIIKLLIKLKLLPRRLIELRNTQEKTLKL